MRRPFLSCSAAPDVANAEQHLMGCFPLGSLVRICGLMLTGGCHVSPPSVDRETLISPGVFCHSPCPWSDMTMRSPVRRSRTMAGSP